MFRLKSLSLEATIIKKGPRKLDYHLIYTIYTVNIFVQKVFSDFFSWKKLNLPITPKNQYNCLDTRESCLFNLPCNYILFTYCTLINFVLFLWNFLYFFFIKIIYCYIFKAVWCEIKHSLVDSAFVQRTSLSVLMLGRISGQYDSMPDI